MTIRIKFCSSNKKSCKKLKIKWQNCKKNVKKPSISKISYRLTSTSLGRDYKELKS